MNKNQALESLFYCSVLSMFAAENCSFFLCDKGWFVAILKLSLCILSANISFFPLHLQLPSKLHFIVQCLWFQDVVVIVSLALGTLIDKLITMLNTRHTFLEIG